MAQCETVRVEAANGSYDILIGEGILSQAGGRIAALGIRRAHIVTDETVEALYGKMLQSALHGAGVEARLTAIRPGEASKSRESLFALYDAFLEGGLNRADAVIALGGGVVGDLAGYAAASFMRGVNLIQIPTTLLAQVDSSVGGKVAIDLPQAKNIVGAFYQPRLVIADLATRRTLPKRQYAAGMAEVIKYAAIFDAALEKAILAGDDVQMVRRSCEIKADYVRRDPLDQGARMELNFGHTVGHALETLSHYEILHGEGVAMGMELMARMGENMGETEPGTADHLRAMMRAAKLSEIGSAYRAEELVSVMARDKKAQMGGVRVIFLTRMGKAHSRLMSLSEIEKELRKLI